MISFNIFIFSFIICIFVIFFSISIFKKKKILLDQTSYSKHKKLVFSISKKPFLCGGIILFICSLFFFDELIILKVFGFCLLSIGLLSDINKITSANTRILFQFFIVLFFVILSNLNIVDLRITFLNDLLNIKYISIIFTVICFLILINGTNFIDGLNTLVVGYYILILSILVLVSNQFNLFINYNIFFLIVFLIVIYIFNLSEKIYLGDSGSYLVSFCAGFFAIDFALKNPLVSPYFICFLFWYPAFENLFSILRRISFNKKVYKPDQLHLHHLIFKFFLRKNFFNKKFANSVTANIINLYNFLIFILLSKYIFITKFLVSAIIFNVILYLIIYFYMKKKA